MNVRPPVRAAHSNLSKTEQCLKCSSFSTFSLVLKYSCCFPTVLFYDSRFMSRELNSIYLDCLVCLPPSEQTEPLAGANVRAQHRVMDTSIVRGRAGCIQAGGSPRGKTLRGVKLSLCLPTDCSD